MPELSKGDTLLMYSGTPGRRDGKRWSEVRIVTLGPKYVGVVSADKYDRYLANPSDWSISVRKFLREDMTEGERGKRIGYSASLATREQQQYDALLDRAMTLLRDRAGIDLRYGTMFDYRKHPERIVELADAVAPLLDKYEVPDDAE
jgi:hypothetical protein